MGMKPPWLPTVKARSGWSRCLINGRKPRFLQYSLRSEMPEITAGCPEGTYLAWLDGRALGLNEAPCEFSCGKRGVGFERRGCIWQGR